MSNALVISDDAGRTLLSIERRHDGTIALRAPDTATELSAADAATLAAFIKDGARLMVYPTTTPAKARILRYTVGPRTADA